MSATPIQAERVSRIPLPHELPDSFRRSYFSDLIRAAFPKQPDNAGCATLFTAAHAGCGVSFICSYVATEVAVQAGKVLLADAKALVELTEKYDEDAFQLCERIEPGRVWILGTQQLRNKGTLRRPPSASLSTVLDQLSKEFPAIVIDAPAVSDSDDALLLSTAVYGTVLVAEADRTDKRAFAEAYRRISGLGGRVLGSIYNSRT